MMMNKGSDILSQSLAAMLRQAGQVQQSIQRIQDAPGAAWMDPHQECCFNEMAAFVATTIDEVSDRLGQVNQVLLQFREQCQLAELEVLRPDRLIQGRRCF